VNPLPVKACNEIRLKLIIDNTKGKGPLQQLSACLSTYPKNPLWEKKLLFIGRVPAKAKMVKEFTLPAYNLFRNPRVILTGHFFEGCGHFPKAAETILRIDTLTWPSFEIGKLTFFEGRDDRGVGDGDGILNKGEGPECVLEIRNKGGKSEEVEVEAEIIGKVRGVEIVGKKKKEQREFKKGDKLIFSFYLAVKRDCKVKEVRIKIRVRDRRLKVEEEKKFSLKIGR